MSYMQDIWYMESELCDDCGTPLDYFGICPVCGIEGVDWFDEDDISADYPAIQLEEE